MSRRKKKSEHRFIPLLKDFIQDTAVYSVPSSDGTGVYEPCIEIYGKQEVYCQCKYFQGKAKFAEWFGSTITVYDYDEQCWHIRDAIQECFKEELL